jgi:hypothetical protein
MFFSSSSPATARGQGGIVFSMADLLKMRAKLQHHHPHQYDDMETFISGRRHQGEDGVITME